MQRDEDLHWDWWGWACRTAGNARCMRFGPRARSLWCCFTLLCPLHCRSSMEWTEEQKLWFCACLFLCLCFCFHMLITMIYNIISTLGKWWNESVVDELARLRQVLEDGIKGKDNSCANEAANLVNEVAAIRQAYTGDESASVPRQRKSRSPARHV